MPIGSAICGILIFTNGSKLAVSAANAAYLNTPSIPRFANMPITSTGLRTLHSALIASPKK